jgi:hypothetical protein
VQVVQRAGLADVVVVVAAGADAKVMDGVQAGQTAAGGGVKERAAVADAQS